MTALTTANMALVLDFASIYQCAIKPFKHAVQKAVVSDFLLNNNSDAPFSDAVCSNYILGRRAIPDEGRRFLAEITEEELESKFNAAGIYNLQLPADALRHLIDHVEMPKRTRNKLVKLHRDSTQGASPSAFLVEVFHLASDAKGSQQLTQDELLLLASFALPDKVPADAVDPDIEEDATEFSNEDLSWMREYLSPRIRINHRAFFGTPVKMDCQTLTLPRDFAPLLYLLKPALKSMPFDTFTFDQFIDVTGIHPVKGTLETGYIECFKLTGSIEGIIPTIELLNLSEACAVVLLMRGRITLQDAGQVEKAIRKASNKKVSFIRALNFDSRLTDAEVTLIVRMDPELARKQITECEAEVKIYER